jgi:hypothetical protein
MKSLVMVNYDNHDLTWPYESLVYHEAVQLTLDIYSDKRVFVKLFCKNSTNVRLKYFVFI